MSSLDYEPTSPCCGTKARCIETEEGPKFQCTKCGAISKHAGIYIGEVAGKTIRDLILMNERLLEEKRKRKKGSVV